MQAAAAGLVHADEVGGVRKRGPGRGLGGKAMKRGLPPLCNGVEQNAPSPTAVDGREELGEARRCEGNPATTLGVEP
jgi:hypothetical protein